MKFNSEVQKVHMNVYPRPDGQKCELRRITPDVAKEWISRATSNFRNKSDGHLDTIVSTIRTEGWWNNGSTFKFDTYGNLIDGQHRAHAIVRLGITVWAWVITGLDDLANERTDTRISLRSTVQFLRKAGKPWYSQLASAIYYLHAHLGGSMRWPQNIKATIQGDLELLRTHPELESSAAIAGPTKLGLVGPLAVIHYVATQAGKGVAADRFVKAFITGEDIGEHDPIGILRARLIEDKSSKARLMRDEKVALLIVAWNAWVAGRPVKSLRWRAVGPLASDFPTVQIPKSEDEDEDETK